MYRSIFIDLDDTVWAFTENARDTFQDMYDKYHFDRYFVLFSHFYTCIAGRMRSCGMNMVLVGLQKIELNDKDLPIRCCR
nr:hypothetical protein [Phocaeicola vulgatus]